LNRDFTNSNGRNQWVKEYLHQKKGIDWVCGFSEFDICLTACSFFLASLAWHFPAVFQPLVVWLNKNGIKI